MLDKRKQRILQAIINDYISTAEPIGSRTIARKYDLGVSPATIRNEMADLELLGYIEQLHTSSGRIPSAKGYRFYVDDLLSPQDITEQDIQLIQSWYAARVKRVEEVFQETAKILSRMTKNISLVLAPQLSQATFRYLQFLPLDGRRVIVVVMTDAGFVENKVMEMPDGISIEDFQRIAMAVNSHLAGLSLDAIRPSLLRKVRADVLSDKNLFDAAMEVVEQVLTVDKRERVYLGGTTQLLEQPEFRDVEKVKELLLMLEEEQLLCDLMHAHEKGEGVAVTIGAENKLQGIQDCSMVSATYSLGGQVIGTIAVLGPTRMEYGKVITLLRFMNEHLGEVLGKYKL